MKKRNILRHTLAALAVFPLTCLAQVTVLGLELGSTTLTEARAQVAKQTTIEDAGVNKFSNGPQFKSDGRGSGIDSLQEVVYIFDAKNTLSGVLMTMDKGRFDEISGVLGKKYKLVAKQRPFVGDMYAQYKASGVTIELSAPHMGFVMQARYVRDDLMAKYKAQVSAETKAAKESEAGKF